MATEITEGTENIVSECFAPCQTKAFIYHRALHVEKDVPVLLFNLCVLCVLCGLIDR